jgi:ferredoxin--NADP+ reductase
MDVGLSNFMKSIRLVEVTIDSLTEISENVFVLTCKRVFDFLPGQVVAITTKQHIPPRLYSICSGSGETGLSVLFNVKPEGELTPRLAKLKAGDTIMISAPFGAFLGDDKPAWWIASGTGIAPYRSMARSGIGHRNTLVHGGRNLGSFYFSDELKQLFSARYIRCCSQESGDGIYHGRLTQWLNNQETLPKNTNFYLCGSSEMVVEVRDILLGKGIEIEKIMSEIYF